MPAYTPWTTRKFGVEMEMREVRTNGQRLTLSHIADALRAQCVVPVRNAGGYGHSDGSVWDVKTDASCGFEVAGPALMMDADRHCDELRRGCQAVSSLTPRIDRTCGLHVHVDCGDFNWRELQTLVSLWCRYEPFFYSLIPPLRRTNRYCKAMRKYAPNAEDVASWRAAQQFLAATSETQARGVVTLISDLNARYHGLNISGWFRHGRVEFRLHSGTSDYEKIRNWVSLVLALVGRVKNTAMPPAGRIVQSAATDFPVRYVGKVLGLIATPECPDVHPTAAALVAWVEARRAQFDPESRPRPAAQPAAARPAGFAAAGDPLPF